MGAQPSLYGAFMLELPYPTDKGGAEAQLQKYHIATFIQSAYRAYTAIAKKADGSYRNLLQEANDCGQKLAKATDSTTCNSDDSVGDHEFVFNSMSAANKRHYKCEGGGAGDDCSKLSGGGDINTLNSYQIIFDITYRLRSLATVYFVHLADAHVKAQGRRGFGVFEFYNYELKAPRPAGWCSNGCDESTSPSDAEMFGLTGHPGRRKFLEAFHNWLVGKMDAQTKPLAAAEEISQTQDALVADIARMVARHKIEDPNNQLPRCADADLPPIDFSTAELLTGVTKSASDTACPHVRQSSNPAPTTLAPTTSTAPMATPEPPVNIT